MSSNLEKNFDSRSGLDRGSQEVLDWRLAAAGMRYFLSHLFFILNPIENTDEFKEEFFENIRNEIARYDTFDGFTNLGGYPIIVYLLLSHSDGWCNKRPPNKFAQEYLEGGRGEDSLLSLPWRSGERDLTTGKQQ